MRALAVILLFSLSGVSVAEAAGPAPQRDRSTFISVATDIPSDGSDGVSTIFLEQGGPDSLRYGFDAGLEETDEDWSAFAFVRQPLSDPGAMAQLSISAGVGAKRLDDSTEPLVVLGGTLDRALGNGPGSFFSLGAEARYGTVSGETDLRGDARLGLSPVDGFALVNQLEVTGTAGSGLDPDSTLTSSVVSRINETARLEIGATFALSGEARPGFRIGTWLEF